VYHLFGNDGSFKLVLQDLLLYLLQLVAAIRYEKVTNEMMATKAAPSHYADESDPTPLGGDPLGVGGDPLGVTGPEMSPKIDKALSVEEECLKLGPFLIARACANPVVANYLYWLVKVLCPMEICHKTHWQLVQVYHGRN
jgi:phosphatidylinositol 3-kinase